MFNRKFAFMLVILSLLLPSGSFSAPIDPQKDCVYQRPENRLSSSFRLSQLSGNYPRKDTRNHERVRRGGHDLIELTESLIWSDTFYTEEIPFPISPISSDPIRPTLVASKQHISCFLMKGDSLLVGDGMNYHWTSFYQYRIKDDKFGIIDKIPDSFLFNNSHNILSVSPERAEIDGQVVFWFSRQDFLRMMIAVVVMVKPKDMEQFLKVNGLYDYENKWAMFDLIMTLGLGDVTFTALHAAFEEVERGNKPQIDLSFYGQSILIRNITNSSNNFLSFSHLIEKILKFQTHSDLTISQFFLQRELKFNLLTRQPMKVKFIGNMLKNMSSEFRSALDIYINFTEFPQTDNNLLIKIENIKNLLLKTASMSSFVDFKLSTFGIEDDQEVYKIFNIYSQIVKDSFEFLNKKSSKDIKIEISSNYYYIFILYPNKYANVENAFEKNCRSVNYWRQKNKDLQISKDESILSMDKVVSSIIGGDCPLRHVNEKNSKNK